MATSSRVFKGILIGLGAVVGLIVLALVLLTLFFPSKQVRELAEKQAATYIAQPVKIGDVGIALWPYIGAKVEQVTVGNDPALTDEPLFSLDRVVVSVNLWKLIVDRDVYVKELLIERPRITVVVNEDGVSSFDNLLVEQPEAPAEEEEPALAVDTTEQVGGIPVGLLLERMRLVDARIHYMDRQTDTELLVDGLNETLSLAIDASANTFSIDGDLGIDGLTLGAEGQGIGPTSIQVGHRAFVDIPADSAAFGLDVALAGIPLSVSGAVRTMSTQPEVFADVETGDILLDRLLQQVNLPEDNQLAQMEASGSVMLDLTAHMVIDSTAEQAPMDVDGTLALKQIRLKHPDLPKAVDQINALVRVSSDDIAIETFIVQAGQSVVSAEALLTGWQTDAPRLAQSHVSVSVVLDEVADIVELPEGTDVGGTVSLNVSASGPVNEPLRMAVDGGVSIKGVHASTPDLPVPVSKVDGSVTFDNNRVLIPDIGIWLGSSEIHLANTSVTDFLVLAMPEEYPNRRTKVNIAVRGPMLNLDEIIPPTEEEEEAVVIPDTTLLIPPIELPPVDVHALVTIDSMIVSEAAFTGLRVTADVGDGSASTSARLTAFEGGVKFDGALNFSEPDDPSYSASWDVSSVQANSILTTFAGFEDRLYGTAFSTGSINGSGGRYGDIKRNLVLDTDFRAGNGYLNNWEVVKESADKIESGVNRVKGGFGSTVVESMGIRGDRFEYGQLDGTAGVTSETLTLTNVGLKANEHQWRTNGTVGTVFDTVNALNVVTELTFGTWTTRQLAESVASGLSLATPVSADDILQYLEPPNHLRVEMRIGGTSVEPDVGMPDLMKPLKDAAENAVRAKLGAARDRATQEAEQRAEEARQQAEEEARERASEAVDKAKSAVKGLFGR